MEGGIVRRDPEPVFFDQNGGGGQALDGRHDGRVKEADGVFALGEEFLQAVAGLVEIATGEAIAEFEDDAAPGLGDEEADVVIEDFAALVAEVGVDFVEFVEDLTGVRTNASGEPFEGVGMEFQFAVAGGAGGGLPRGFVFVEARATARLVEDIGGGKLGQGLVKGAAFVRADRAEEEPRALRDSAFEHLLQFLECFEHGLASAELGVGKEIRAFEPDKFFRGEKSRHAEREDGLADDRRGVLRVVGVRVERFHRELAALRGRQFRGQFFGAGLDRHFVISGDEMDRGVLGGFFGLGRHAGSAAALHKVVAAELHTAPDWKKLRVTLRIFHLSYFAKLWSRSLGRLVVGWTR